MCVFKAYLKPLERQSMCLKKQKSVTFCRHQMAVAASAADTYRAEAAVAAAAAETPATAASAGAFPDGDAAARSSSAPMPAAAALVSSRSAGSEHSDSPRSLGSAGSGGAGSGGLAPVAGVDAAGELAATWGNSAATRASAAAAAGETPALESSTVAAAVDLGTARGDTSDKAPAQGLESSLFGGAKELKWEELKVGAVVGKGSFGQVSEIEGLVVGSRSRAPRERPQICMLPPDAHLGPALPRGYV